MIRLLEFRKLGLRRRVLTMRPDSKGYRPAMPDFVAIGCKTPEAASQIRAALLRYDVDRLDELGDAIMASVDDYGAVDLDANVNLWSTAPKAKMLWNLLVGLLFLHPIMAVLQVDTATQITSALTGFGLDDPYLTQLRELLVPGRAVLFLLVNAPLGYRLADEIEQQGTRILQRQVNLTAIGTVETAFALGHRDAMQQRRTKYSGGYFLP